MSASSIAPAREKRPGATAKAFSIRLTEGERLHLKARADGRPLATFVRELVLSGAGSPRNRSPKPAHVELARLLAALGQSRISSNLNQLAKAVNMGALPVTEETEAEIREACREIAALRSEVMRALGVTQGGSQ